MRSIADVIDQIVEALPDGEYAALRAEVKDIKYSSYYTAPEVMYTRWRQLAHVLGQRLDGAGELETKIRAIMAGEPVKA